MSRINQLRNALKRQAACYSALARLRAFRYALLEWSSRLLTALRGRETLLGIDFLPSPEQPAYACELLVCLRFKNEAPYLQEWIEYHRMVGVDHFVLYNNNSDDNYASVLRPYLESGLVTLREWPRVPASPSAELDCIATFRNTARLIAFIDADEFIVPLRDESLTETLARLRPAGALSISWRYFGSAFHQTKPEGLVVAAYQRSNARIDKHIKCIVNPRRVVKYGNSHFWYLTNFETARNEAGRKVFGSLCFQTSAQDLVIHHYVHKSAEEFLARARMKSRVDARGMSEATRPENALSRAFPEHNEMPNFTMNRFAGALAERCGLTPSRL